MSSNEYEKAYRSGRKDLTSRSMRGLDPYLPVLDDILKTTKALTEVPLGLVQIPTELLIGTKSADRSNAFAHNFMPVLGDHTEFAYKWESLCSSHMEEGIREPIKAYEYMNKFYVQEGNKRVSVLKFFNAVSVPGYVTRIIPPRTDDKENRIYYEFLDFYKLSEINYIWFTKEGSFAKLQRLVGKRPDEPWTYEEKLTFSAVLSRFTAEYQEKDSGLPITVGDAFLSFIEVYEYEDVKEMTTAQLQNFLIKSRKEFEVLFSSKPLDLQMNPGEDKKNNLLRLLLPSSSATLHIAFIHEKSSETSGWTYAHELGRMHLEDTFGDEIVTSCYDNVTVDNADEVIEEAITAGNEIIFTTSPPLLPASIKTAIKYPDIKILNCSLNASHQYIRTYYGRMYEAKFLMGAIAGALTKNDKLGYIADYPIFGMAANINAFALGAKMVNPYVKVHLKWSTLKDSGPIHELRDLGITCISGQDMITPGLASRYFGTFRLEKDYTFNLAMPVWHWGKFYEKMIRTIISGSWKNDEQNSQSKAINYWWGMSSDVIDVICSNNLPIGTTRLVKLLRDVICSGEFNPFSGVLFSQKGIVQSDENAILTPEQIITMDWLAENIVGEIPKLEDLVDNAKPVVLLQGIDNTVQNKE